VSEVGQPTPPSTTNRGAPTSRLQRIYAYRWLLWLATGVFVLDQVTKFLIATNLATGTYGPPGHIPIIPGFFNLVHVGNTGAAWSLFAGKSTMLALLAVTTLAAIFLWRRSLGLRLLPVQISFGLLCGGILGNLLDRLVYKHVIDFLDFHFGNYIYPTFNIADSGICVGVGIYLWYSFKNPAPKQPEPHGHTQT
jgi:signal peptidase II